MLIWMLYVVVVTLLLSGAALAAEYAARHWRARSRGIWLATILASLIIPTLIASVSVQLPNLLSPTSLQQLTALRDLTTVQLVPLTWVREHANAGGLHSENRLLQHAWIALSAALFAALLFNGLYLMRRKRQWQSGVVAGVPAYIVPDVGPAVVGLLRPRIVIPRWLMDAPASRQLLVLAHEQSHLAARDPLLLTVALSLLVLMPWNLPLWWQLRRLRRAIEVDCDARVLTTGVDAAQYGETLIDVSQRPAGYTGAVAAMSESTSFLEQRIALMVSNPGKWAPLLITLFATFSIALLTLAIQVTPPNSDRPVVLSANVLDRYVGFYLRGANVIYTVTREGDHLNWFYQPYFQMPLAANPDMTFAFKGVNGAPTLSFPQDSFGRAVAVLMPQGPVMGISFLIRMPRIDAVTADAIRKKNAVRARDQVPVAGSDGALRRLINGIMAGKPNYSEMTPWYAELVKQASPITRSIYGRMGKVTSVKFKRVTDAGGDEYSVGWEVGKSTWTIYMDADGTIEDADDYPE
jgi:bla regulator protein blaR1